MKAFEFLKQHAETLLRMNRAGLNSTSVAQLEMYEEYKSMLKEGGSPYKAVMQLAIIHGVTERTIYRIIEIMQRDV